MWLLHIKSNMFGYFVNATWNLSQQSEVLKEAAQNFGLSVEPERILMDFELALQQSIAICFPQAERKGCLFYFAAWRGLKRNAPAFSNDEEFFQYFEETWIEGNFPIVCGFVYSLHANTLAFQAEEASKRSTPNVYEAVNLFKSEQAATEITLLATGSLPVRRRKYRIQEKRLTTIKEKYEASDYTLSEHISAFSNCMGIILVLSL